MMAVSCEQSSKDTGRAVGMKRRSTSYSLLCAMVLAMAAGLLGSYGHSIAQEQQALTASMPGTGSQEGPGRGRIALRGLAVRREAVLQYFGGGAVMNGVDSWAAAFKDVLTVPGEDLAVVTACLAAQEKLDQAYKIYSAQACQPQPDLNRQFLLVAAYWHGRESLPDSIRLLVQRHFAVHPMVRGRSELDWHLYYSTLLLAAQAWPQTTAEGWFNGKSSAENYHEASDYLSHWMQRVATQGQSEFDSPAYLPSFLAPLFVVYDFAEDEQLRRRSRVILDLLLADFAAEHLSGQYAGGHSRNPTPLNSASSRSQTAALAWLLFGVGEMTSLSLGAELLLAALSSYEVPEVVLGIGAERDRSYVHRERKAHAALYRRSLAGNDAHAVRKYTYITREYAIGSLAGALQHPYEQQSWSVTRSGDGLPLFFATHPYAGDPTLGMFFPDPPPVLAQKMARDAGSADKLYGASPFEKVLQHRNVLIALYDIPARAPNPQVNGFLSKAVTIHQRDDSGWILCQAGRTFLALRFLRPVELQEIPEGWRLQSFGRRNAVIVEVSSADDFPSFEEFKSHLAETRLESKNILPPDKLAITASDGIRDGAARAEELLSGMAKLTYTSSYGDAFEISAAGERKINGYPTPVGRWPLFDGPFVKADERHNTVLLHNDRLWRQLNLTSWEIHDIDGSFGEDLTRSR